MAKTSILFLIVSCIICTNCEIFSAINELEKLAEAEGTILEELENLASKLGDNYLNKKLKSWQDEYALVEKDITKYISNPLNAFLMIKRCTSDVELIEKRFPEQSKGFLEKIKTLQPDNGDLMGATEGLLRLQTVYGLKCLDFAKGVIDGEKTRADLTPHDLFVIGSEAFKLKSHGYIEPNYFAREYLFLAWNQYLNGRDVDNEIDVAQLLLELSETYNRTEDYFYALEYIDRLLEQQPEQVYRDVRAMYQEALDVRGRKNLIAQQSPFDEYFDKNGQFSSHKERIIYSKTCRGEFTKTPKEKAELKCRFLAKTPFSQLAPFKIEEANLDPYLIVFIDVLTDEEIIHLKELTRPKVARALTINVNVAGVMSSLRVAQLAWHDDKDDAILRRISRRVEDMTGLTLETSEMLQVQNYGIGGHYVPHWDHTTKSQAPFDLGTGNRIATVLFYLSDVEKGGATVFPYLKATISARKGTAAFWHNLRNSGQGDYYTRHAACPVLIGSKWVANKWIHEFGQEFNRPCLPQVFEETSEAAYLDEFF